MTLGIRTVLGVDGGNSKTDVALVAEDGRLLGAVRGPTVSHQAVGIEAGMARLAGLVSDVHVDADPSTPGLAVLGLAGADLPADVRMLQRSVERLRLAERVVIVNDAFAALRAGTDEPWGVALICGQGTNAAAVAPNGRRARLDALGQISGDWGGGGDIGWAAVAAAVRARDGRGPATSLARLVPQHFGLPNPVALTRAFYRGQLADRRVSELAPVVFEAAAHGDPIARAILDRQADELVAMAAALIRRLRMQRESFRVVLAGGVFRAEDEPFYERIRAGIATVAPRAVVVRLDAPPVLGPVLDALDRLAGGMVAPDVAATVRRSLCMWDGRPPRP